MSVGSFSNFIVYVDEAGDHGAVSPQFPVFVLAFCIFEKSTYAAEITTSLTRLKFEFFGHDALVLHEREIRKERGPFSILRERPVRERFLTAVNTLIADAKFTLVAAVIEKAKLRERYATPANPYHLAVKFGLERIASFVKERNDNGKLSVVFESRGHDENKDLELEFRRVCSDNALGRQLPFVPHFALKSAVHAGLEIADLVARPIGTHVMRRAQANRAYDVIKTKFRTSPEGECRGWGLKCFP